MALLLKECPQVKAHVEKQVQAAKLSAGKHVEAAKRQSSLRPDNLDQLQEALEGMGTRLQDHFDSVVCDLDDNYKLEPKFRREKGDGSKSKVKVVLFPNIMGPALSQTRSP